MPLERVSQGFKDVSASFQVNPINYDLVTIKNVTAINRSIRNLILTVPGEKPFTPDLGCYCSRLLFEQFNDQTANQIRIEIERTINTYEPRVSLQGVDVRANIDSNEFDVIIRYYVIGANARTQQLSFALQPTR